MAMSIRDVVIKFLMEEVCVLKKLESIGRSDDA